MGTRSWQGPGALRRARQLEEMGVAVAHQLKNPLSGVKALLQLGLRNPAESLSHPRLAAVEGEVERMQEMLQSHLASGRPRAFGRKGAPGSGLPARARAA